MSRTLSIRNRQRVRPVDTALLRQIARHILLEELRIEQFELALHLVAAPEMARVNQAFLNHEGSTDVITFDYGEQFRVSGFEFGVGNAADAPPRLETRDAKLETKLSGEIYICLDDAVKQAKEFRTSWQSELARYVIHGFLHLCGHDDLRPAARRVMKREENRLLRIVTKAFALAQLQTRNPKRETSRPLRPPR